MLYEIFLLLFVFTIGVYLLGGIKAIPIMLLAAGVLSASLGIILFTDGVSVPENYHLYRNELDSNRIMDVNATYSTYFAYPGTVDGTTDKKPDGGLFIIAMVLFFGGIITAASSIVPISRGRIFQ